MAKIKTSRGTLKYKPVVLYPGIKKMDKEKAHENFKIIASFLDKNGIKWGPVIGTLLGMVREHDYIEWDEDIDLWIFEEDEDRFKDMLWDIKELGFDIVRYYRRGLYSIMRNDEYIDFCVMHKVGKNVRYNGGQAFMLEKYLQDTIPLDFKGITVQIPREYDEFLTFRYGDWRTPVQYLNFNMGFFKKNYIKFRLWLMYYIPECIYHKIRIRNHAKELEKFKAKCRSHGIMDAEDAVLDI